MKPAHRALRGWARGAAWLAVTFATTTAHAGEFRASRAEQAELTVLLQRFFEATRDGNFRASAALIPTREEFLRIYQPGTEPFLQRHQRALERDVRELRARFAGGAWLRVTGPLVAGAAVPVQPCGRFGAPGSECVDGPVIEWRAGGEVRRLRVDRLVRVDGRWKIFDARL